MNNENEFDSHELPHGGHEHGDSAEGIEPIVEGSLARAARPTSDSAITREQRRSRRKREVRARTISVKRMTKRELEIGRMLYPETDYNKPQTRADCAEGLRPCPYVSCKHHLFLDVSARTGAIKLNFPDLEVWDMNESARSTCGPRRHDARGRRRDHEPDAGAHPPGRGEGAREAPGAAGHDGPARLRRRGSGRQAPPPCHRERRRTRTRTRSRSRPRRTTTRTRSRPLRPRRERDRSCSRTPPSSTAWVDFLRRARWRGALRSSRARARVTSGAGFSPARPRQPRIARSRKGCRRRTSGAEASRSRAAPSR
jgi:hypothetical protein